MIHKNLQTTQTLISLQISTGWSGPLWFAYRISGYCSICPGTENSQMLTVIWTYIVHRMHKGPFMSWASNVVPQYAICCSTIFTLNIWTPQILTVNILTFRKIHLITWLYIYELPDEWQTVQTLIGLLFLQSLMQSDLVFFVCSGMTVQIFRINMIWQELFPISNTIK